jgi:DNA-binding PadR family transcriptional regulator
MTPKSLQILLALGQGPLHGYGIKAAVEERSGGTVTLGAGTLYEGIYRLLKAGWLEEVEGAVEDAPPSGGPPRRYYALSAEGREAARQELRRLAEVLQYGEEQGLMEDAS